MSKNKDVEVLRQSIRAITQILTESDVRVTQRGMDAYTKCDPRTGKLIEINLPYLPDDAPDSLIQAVQGYLDHEVGHALFTDFGAVKSVTSDEVKQLQNIVEDAFVERKMNEKFRGCAYNLGNVSRFYMERHLDKVIAAGDESEIKRSLIVAAIRALSGQEAYIDYMKDKWGYLDEFKKKVEPLSKQLSSTQSTKDCIAAARSIIKALRDEQPESPSSPEEEPDEESDQSKPNSKGEKDNEKNKPNAAKEDEEADDSENADSEPSDEESNSEEDSESEEEEREEEPESESGDEGEGDESEESEGDNSEGDSSEGDDAGDSSDPSSSENDGDDSSGEESSDESGDSDEESEAESDSPPSMSEIIKSGISSGNYGESLAKEVAVKAKSSEYIIYTDEYDVIGQFEAINFGKLVSDEETTRFEDQVSHMMNPIQKDIERAICARSASTHTGGFRSGKLHSSSLSRLAVNDDRIFRRKQVNTTKDVAVSLVVDCSGSMSGSKIRLAAIAAFTLSSVLDRLNINHEVIGFTTGEIPNEVQRKMRDEMNTHGIEYARYESIVMPVFKGYGEKMSHKVKRRLASAYEGSLGSNVDGESVAIAAKRLSAQKEKGKVMIVLSDGMPAVYGASGDISDHLRDTVRQIEASGINTVGIGIHSKAVESFYSKSIYVDDINQLPTVVAKQLKQMLLAGSK